MKRIERIGLFILIGLFCSGNLAARKEYKQVRAFMKASNMGEAVKLVDKCKKDSAMMNDPELYVLSSEVQRKLNDDQNVRLYLKQAYDTVSFFSSIYGIFDDLITCDEKESIPDSKGRVHIKKRSKSHSTLKMYYPNLFNAGLFFIKKKQYQEADKYFSMYINAAATPIFIADSLQKRDNKMPRAAFWSMTSCYELKKYKDVFKFKDLAMRDSANIELCLQYASMSYAALNNKAGMVSELKRGIQYDDKDLFFFSHLADYYNSEKDYKQGLALCDSMIKEDSAKVMYKFAKVVVLFNLKRYEECKALSKEVIKKDSANADTYYYMASCFYNQATDIDDNIKSDLSANAYSKEKKKVNKLFEQSLPYMEQYRKMRPDDTARWAAPLYRIYLSLNMGKQFEEMDSLLKKIEAEKAEKEKAKQGDNKK